MRRLPYLSLAVVPLLARVLVGSAAAKTIRDHGEALLAIRSSDAASLVLYDDPVQTVLKSIFLSLH
jgi:hypothetical protein